MTLTAPQARALADKACKLMVHLYPGDSIRVFDALNQLAEMLEREVTVTQEMIETASRTIEKRVGRDPDAHLDMVPNWKYRQDDMRAVLEAVLLAHPMSVNKEAVPLLFKVYHAAFHLMDESAEEAGVFTVGANEHAELSAALDAVEAAYPIEDGAFHVRLEQLQGEKP